MPARLPLFLALFALCAAPTAASAETAVVALQLRSPSLAACPEAAALAREINAVLSRDAVSVEPPAGPHATIQIEFAPVTGGIQALLSLAGPDGSSLGSRQIRHPGKSCAALAGPAAIVGALLVDVARVEIAISLPKPPPEPPPAAPVSEPPPAVAAPPPPRAVGARGEVAAAALVGLLPRVAGGVRSSLRARGSKEDGSPWPAWITAQVEVFPTSVTPGSGPGGAFSAWTAGLGLCAPFVEGPRVEIEGCAAGAAGAIKGVGTGARLVRESTSLLALIEADAAIRLRITGPIWARLSAGAATGHRPASFSFDRAGDPLVVHRSWPLLFVGTAGISIGE